jgi:PKHD-type hydroxylase
MKNNPSWIFYPDHVERWAYLNGVFTPEECSKIVQYGKSLNMNKATVINDGKEEYDVTVRDSNIVFLTPEPEHNWIWQKITEAVLNLNSTYFKFDLFGITEGLQFTEYHAPSGNYGSHIDKIYGGLVRKLSFVVQLSDENDYDGGQFEILDSEPAQIAPKQQGTLFAFPSYTLHRVTPVTKGTRYSLVGWITGTPFK